MNVTDDPELADVFGEFMAALHKGTDAAVLDAFVEMDLTLTQARSLFLLAQREGEDAAPIGELAEAVHVSVATAGRAVDRLTTLGLVDRREDPADRRSRLVTLTAQGRELADTQKEGMRERLRAFTRALPEDVAETLRSAILAAIAAAPEQFHAGTACTFDSVRTR